jgi:hypothetical protein
MSKLKPLPEASGLTRTFRSKKASVIHGKPDILPDGFLFDKSQIQSLLDQGDCTGLRIYCSMDASNNISLLAVGTDVSNTDILTAINPLIVGEPYPCPPMCGGNSPLNS